VRKVRKVREGSEGRKEVKEGRKEIKEGSGGKEVKLGGLAWQT
jgi:hypothetical protein